MEMVFCRTCKHANPASAAICDFCGADLRKQIVAVEHAGKRPAETNLLPQEEQVDFPEDTKAVPAHGIAIYLADSKKPFLVSDRSELTLGRRTSEAAGPEIVDLTNQGAYECGVSRRHVRIQRTAGGYEIVDLASSNGSWIGEVHLEAGQAYPLPKVSRLRLGRMQLILVYN